MFRRHCITALALLLMAAAAPALAGKGGSHGNATASASCSALDGTVTASGLPTNEVINFMVTDASGSYGWVLGFTPDGTWTVQAPVGASYEFVSRTWGPSGSKYSVFASC